jgi:hypothetical protein
MKQNFRYLQHIRDYWDYWLQYFGEEMILSGFCNANWAGDLNMRKSIDDFAFLLNNVVITWSSRKQPTYITIMYIIWWPHVR